MLAASENDQDQGAGPKAFAGELLRLYARNHREGMTVIPVLAAVLALVGTQWVGWEPAAAWYVSLAGATLLGQRTLAAFLAADPPANELPGWKRRILAVRLLFVSTWSASAGLVFFTQDVGVAYLAAALVGLPLFCIALVSAPWYPFFIAEAIPMAAAGATVVGARAEHLSGSLGTICVAYLGACILLSARLQREAVRRLVLEHEVKRGREEAEEARRRLEELAGTDELTGIMNRRAFFERAEREIERAGRYGHSMAVLLLDVDHFKSINDRHGHSAGDDALSMLAEAAGQILRSSDMLARLGGEEFVALLPETDSELAYKVAERMRQYTEGLELQVQDTAIRLTISLGVAGLEHGADSLAELIDQADRALYTAKSAGRNRVVLATPGREPHAD